MNILDQVLNQLEQARRSISIYFPVVEYNGSTVRISNLPVLPALPTINLTQVDLSWMHVEIPALDQEVFILIAGTLWMCFMLAVHIYILSHPAIIVIFFIASLFGMFASYMAAIN